MTANLFIQHHEAVHGLPEDSVGSGWENTFTESLGFYLSCDQEVLAALCREVLAGDDEEPEGVEPQFVDHSERPDLAIHLRSGRMLLLEHKVDAEMQATQLERYLKIRNLDGDRAFVALFAKRSHDLSAEVLSDSRYRHPAGRPHFFWRDLFSLIPRETGTALGIPAMRRCFRDYLGLLGFAPSSLTEKWKLLFEDRELDEPRRVQQEFGQRLAPVRAQLKKLGFEVESSSYKGLAGGPPTGSGFRALKVSPRRAPRGRLGCAEDLVKNEVLSVALVFDGASRDAMAQEIRSRFPVPFEDRQGRRWFAAVPYAFNNNTRTILEFVTDLDWFVQDEPLIEARLSASCAEAISMVLRIASPTPSK